MRFLDYENQEKDYKPFQFTRENIKANIGKQIVYVTRRDYHAPRGTYFVRYGILHSVKRNDVFLNDGHDAISLSKGCVLEVGIKKI